MLKFALLLCMCVGLARSDSEPESDAQFALGPDPTYLDLLGANVAAVEYEYQPTVVVKEQVAPPTVVNTQFHAQSELGEYEYGYSNPTSSKYESRDAYGNVAGSYSYLSPDGRVVTNSYVADPAAGFRSSLAPHPENAPIAVVDAPVHHAPVAPVAPAPIPSDPLVGVEIGRAIAAEVRHAAPAAAAPAFAIHEAVPSDSLIPSIAAAAAVPPPAAVSVSAPSPNLIEHAVRHHVVPEPVEPVVTFRQAAHRTPTNIVNVVEPAPRVLEVAPAPHPVPRHSARVVEVAPQVHHHSRIAPAHHPRVVKVSRRRRPATIIKKTIVKSLPASPRSYSVGGIRSRPGGYVRAYSSPPAYHHRYGGRYGSGGRW